MQDQGRPNQERIASAYLATHDKKKRANKGKDKDKTPLNMVNKGDVRFFFHNKKQK